jgi:hypothetical protein
MCGAPAAQESAKACALGFGLAVTDHAEQVKRAYRFIKYHSALALGS